MCGHKQAEDIVQNRKKNPEITVAMQAFRKNVGCFDMFLDFSFQFNLFMAYLGFGLWDFQLNAYNK